MDAEAIASLDQLNAIMNVASDDAMSIDEPVSKDASLIPASDDFQTLPEAPVNDAQENLADNLDISNISNSDSIHDITIPKCPQSILDETTAQNAQIAGFKPHIVMECTAFVKEIKQRITIYQDLK